MIEKQIKNLAWNTFKQTGNINTFMEFKKIDNMEKNELENLTGDTEGIQYGNYQDKGNNPFGK